MTASLQTKDSTVYIVLNWRQGTTRKQKWVPTELPIKYGKRIGEATRIAVLNEWIPKMCANYADMSLGDYLKDWVSRKRTTIEETTYREYLRMIEHTIAPYFDGAGVRLQTCKACDIEKFYTHKMDVGGVSANTVSHYQACLFSAFKDACRLDHVASNPAEKVVLPKVQKFKGAYYTPSEVELLLEASMGTWLEIPVYLAVWFGLRRGEIAGIRWSDIDFDKKTLTISGVVSYNSGAEQKLQYRGRAKSAAGMRAFPLTDAHVKKLKHWKAQQSANRLIAGAEYDVEWEAFLCVHELGGLISPNYVSWAFPVFLKKHGLRKVRFHDLRHTNAVLLLSNGATMQEVQSWLGHENYSTTDEFYGGILAETKRRTAGILESALSAKPAKNASG